MYKSVDNFENHTRIPVSYDAYTLMCGKTIKIYQIERVHDLIQFIGYGKYLNNNKGDVYFRGQTDLYDGAMIPSLFRGVKNYKNIYNKQSEKINSLIRDSSVFKNYKREVLDPILQHYGVKTRWIDLVDNVWVALWFALHETKSEVLKGREYIYYYESQKDFAYIILLGTDAHTLSVPYGVYTGKTTTLVDLRKATPSFFLRPHAQHAYMITKNNHIAPDYSDLIIGIAKIPTALGLKWLGENDFLNLNTLFPPVHFDTGYSLLINNYPEESKSTVKNYGSIQIISN